MMRGGAGRRVKAAWHFALFLSIYGTFQIDIVSVFFDGLVNIHNLSLLLSHISLEIAVYFLCITCYPESSGPRWLLPVLIGAVVTSTLIFVCGPVNAPENPLLAQAPEKASHLAFKVWSDVYGLVLVGIIPFPHLLRALQSPEANASASVQARNLIFLLALLAGWLSMALRAVVSTITFCIPTCYISPATVEAISMVTLFLAMSWPLVLLSNKLLLMPQQIGEYIEAVRTSVDLARLTKRLNCHFKPIYPEHPSWWDHLTQPSFHIYRSLITILDGKRKLAALNRPASDLGDARSLELNLLHRSLLSVPDSPDYKYLVERYRSVAKELDAAPLLKYAMLPSTNPGRKYGL